MSQPAALRETCPRPAHAWQMQSHKQQHLVVIMVIIIKVILIVVIIIIVARG